jgi:hypothetical protein
VVLTVGQLEDILKDLLEGKEPKDTLRLDKSILNTLRTRYEPVIVGRNVSTWLI